MNRLQAREEPSFLLDQIVARRLPVFLEKIRALAIFLSRVAYDPEQGGSHDDSWQDSRVRSLRIGSRGIPPPGAGRVGFRHDRLHPQGGPASDDGNAGDRTQRV